MVLMTLNMASHAAGGNLQSAPLPYFHFTLLTFTGIPPAAAD